MDVVDGAPRDSVRDEGPGGAAPARGSGLLERRDSVEALGGTITIAGPQGERTTPAAKLPLADTFDPRPTLPAGERRPSSRNGAKYAVRPARGASI